MYVPSSSWVDAKLPGTVVTFYSYKGGTGRSMALANVAWVLASCGKRVLVIDWDLEAPGLHRYFQPFLVDPELTDTDGLVDYLWSVTRSVMSPEDGAPPDLLDYVVGLEWKFDGGGGLDFIPAGRQGPGYAQRVNAFDWQNFYERLGGGAALNAIRDLLRREYEYVLIDSRTGVSDTSGVCTVQLPDILVGLFTFNNQSIEGVSAVFESAMQLRKGQEGALTVLPVVSRVEDGEQAKLEAARARARSVFARFLPGNAQENRRYWDDMEIPYKKFYAYEEVLAAFGDRAGTQGADASLLTRMERLARRVTGKEFSMPEIAESVRQDILVKFSFGGSVNQGLIDDDPKLRELHDRVVAKYESWLKDRSLENALSVSDLEQLDVSRINITSINPPLAEFATMSREWNNYRKGVSDVAFGSVGLAFVVSFALTLLSLFTSVVSFTTWIPVVVIGFYLVPLTWMLMTMRLNTIKINDVIIYLINSIRVNRHNKRE